MKPIDKLPKAEQEQSSQESVHKTRAAGKPAKLRWTMARCRKVANRFRTEDEWRKGAPSSWKSATAHGWVAEIVRHLEVRNRTRESNPQVPKDEAA
jgi:phage protein D